MIQAAVGEEECMTEMKKPADEQGVIKAPTTTTTTTATVRTTTTEELIIEDYFQNFLADSEEDSTETIEGKALFTSGDEKFWECNGKAFKCCVSSKGKPTKLQDMHTEELPAARSFGDETGCGYMFGDTYHNGPKRQDTCLVLASVLKEITGADFAGIRSSLEKADSSEGLPGTYYVTSRKGKLKKWFPDNSYGCHVGWYTDNGKTGYPYCPGDTIELHPPEFSDLNAKERVNKGWNNGVSCMTCTEHGSASQSYLHKTFKMVCSSDGVISSMKEFFSDILYGSNTFTFERDGTFGFPDGAGSSGLYQKWTAGTNGKMVWTTYHDIICSGICGLRYTLVDTAAGFGSTASGSTWFTIRNYYEAGEATCDIQLL